MRPSAAPAARPRRRIRRLATAALACSVTMGAVAGAASAATPMDFSPYVPRAVATVDNCTAEVGPVLDSVPAPNYHKIGGVRVNCSTVHSIVKATVWEQYSANGSTWSNYGYSSVGVRYGQAGSGYGLGGILRSPATCGPRGYYWRTAALVQTERAGAYVYSPAARDVSGC